MNRFNYEKTNIDWVVDGDEILEDVASFLTEKNPNKTIQKNELRIDMDNCLKLKGFFNNFLIDFQAQVLLPANEFVTILLVHVVPDVDAIDELDEILYHACKGANWVSL